MLAYKQSDHVFMDQVRTSNIMMYDDINEFKELIDMQAKEKEKEATKKRNAPPITTRERSIELTSDGKR